MSISPLSAFLLSPGSLTDLDPKADKKKNALDPTISKKKTDRHSERGGGSRGNSIFWT